MPSLEELIAGCQRGQAAAQRGLYERLAFGLMGVCLRYCRSRAEAEDVLQQAFLKIFLRIGQYRHDGPFEAWARRIVVNTALHDWNSRATRDAGSNVSWDDVPEPALGGGNALDQLSADDVVALINSLPPGYRMVLNLFAIEGYSHQEIGELLGISEGTSKSQLARARRLLESKLTLTPSANMLPK